MGKRKKKDSTKILKRILISLIAVIVLLVGVGIFYIYNVLGKIEKTEINKEDLGIVKEESGKDITNIVLFGVDVPKGQTGRSDSIMILSLDKAHKKIKLTSIMRDSYVNIPGRGMDKINHAYAFGGPQLAIKTLNTNFGLNIENFLTVNFTSLPLIIDKIGGVDINLTNGDLKYLNQHLGNKSTPVNGTGIHTLDGEQAMAYCRIRYDGGDQRRTERHRTVLEAVLKKIKEVPASKIPGIITDLLPYVETNYSSTEILGLGTSNMSLLNTDMVQYRLPEDGKYQGKNIKGVYYTVFDIKETKNDLKKFIYEN
ncbi:LCP family protein [uncultured Clostridium sp.]|uniref:LCP family protein n=1 Tax=uncultured Clostridium sp. TaxID=59620 RepID=UPI0025900561|nr:LCP family protein [uncultured Clostridium sp.]